MDIGIGLPNAVRGVDRRGGVGPPTARGGRPTLLIGGASDAAFRRAAQHADGWTMGGAGPDQFGKAREKLDAAWRAAGRQGEPRTMALAYFALGDTPSATRARSSATTTHSWATTPSRSCSRRPRTSRR